MRHILILLAVATWAGPTAAQSRPEDGGSAPATTRPAGTWRYWTRCNTGKVVAHEPGALWFAADTTYALPGILWRYDLKTGQIRSLCRLDGIEAITGPNALVPGKDLASVKPLLFAGRCALPGRGWVAVPQTAWGRQMLSSRLRPDGTLVYREFIPGRPGRIMEYRDEWTPGVMIPSCRNFLPLANGYLLFGTGNTGEGIPIFYDLEGKASAASPVGGAQRDESQTYRVGERTYIVLTKSRGNTREEQILYDATTGSLVEKARGDAVGPDLAGKGLLSGRVTDSPGRGRKFTIALPDGTTVETPLIAVGRPALCRDANGHVWLNAFRWDGRKWELVVPREHHFLTGGQFPSIAAQVATLDREGRNWSIKSVEGLPPHIFAFDPNSKTGWSLDSSDQSPRTLRLERVVDGRRETLHESKTFSPYPPALILDAEGQWWWIGYEQAAVAARTTQPAGIILRGVVRLAGAKEYFYRTKPSTSGDEGQLFYGRSRKIWLHDAAGWSCWDAKSDTFVAGEPWDEFAFQAGPLTLSIVAQRGPHSTLPVSSMQAGLRRKEGGKWVPMLDPLGKGEIFGVLGMAWKDRIVVTSRNLGVLEYDAVNDRWALLHSHTGFTAFFDAGGRRILVNDYYVLAYDGDTFGAPALGGDDKKELEEFRDLLARMDNDSWRIRDQATADLLKSARKHESRIRAALKARQVSLEVQARLQRVLEESGLDDKAIIDGKPDLGTSLFDRMHPPSEIKTVPRLTSP